jgi:ribonuclease T1
MRAGSSRRLVSLVGALLTLIVVVAGIVFGQANGGARPTATAGRPTVIATAIAAVPVATTSTKPTPTATSRVVATATVTPTVVNRPPPTATSPPRAPSAAPAANDGLPTVPFGALPPEAQQTITLIDRNGPFPYDRDGITFSNREGLLPAQANGYYREFTVVTPGSADRGARRIIAGRDGQLYYTDDHYESFRRVVR